MKGYIFNDQANNNEIENALQKAFQGRMLSDQAKKSLRIRCVNILKSAHPEDIQLKFYLTNCYYISQLLGLEPKQFDPLAEEAFSGSVFYVDTNVLILGFLSSGLAEQKFEEMVSLTKRLNIELRVTRATIDEARVTAMDQVSALRELEGKYPKNILKRTGNRFVEAFLEEKERNHAIDPDEVFSAFNHISEIIPAWGISIDDQTADEIIKGRDTQCESEIIQQITRKRRGTPKPGYVLRHDIAHLFLVDEQRKNNPKTWFLTRDGSLIDASRAIGKDKSSLCFSFLGFLQSISPFLRTPSEQHSFADVFETLLKEQIFPTQPFFDIGELRLLAEKNSNVLATPEDQLILALEHLKKEVLKGRPYTTEDIPEVSLALATYMASESSLREKELINTRERLIGEKERLKEEVEGARKLHEATLVQIQTESQENVNLKAQIDKLNTRIEKFERESSERIIRRRKLLQSIGILCGLCIWAMRDYLWKALSIRRSQNVHNSRVQFICTIGIGIGGLIILCLSLLKCLRDKNIRRNAKIVVAAGVSVAVMLCSTLLKSQTISGIANAIQIGSAIAVVLVLMFADSRRAKD